MKNLKYLFIFVFLFGCVQPKFESVKIVDEYGKTAKINKIIPAFNEEQMLKQKEAFNNNNNTTTKVNKFRQNYNNPDENSDVFNDDSNIITNNINKYPDDIFADRITNYRYLDNNHKVQIIDQSKQNEDKNINKVVQTEVIENKKQMVLTHENEEIKSDNNVKNNNKNNKPKSTAKTRGFYIQIGIYSEKNNANTAYKKYSSIHSGDIEEYISKNKAQYKVLLGPYSNKKLAEKDLEKIIKTGHYDVYITEKK